MSSLVCIRRACALVILAHCACIHEETRSSKDKLYRPFSKRQQYAIHEAALKCRTIHQLIVCLKSRTFNIPRR